MPFIEDKNQQQAFARSVGSDFVAEGADPQSYLDDVVMPAFRTENTIGSYLARNGDLPDTATNPDFNPFDHFTDEEKLDPVFVENAALADNTAEIDAVRSQQQRERRDRKRLADAGADAFFTTVAVSMADPINLIPVGGTAYKTYRGGASILAGAAATGSVAAGSTAVTEAALHHSQIERTYGESAVNVTGAFFLGGVLGSLGPATQAIKGKKDIAQFSDEIDKSLDPEPVIAKGGDSVGAMATFQDVQVKGKIAKGLTKLFSLDPLSRAVTSELPETRSLAANLAESPIAFEKGVGQATETRIKLHDGKYADSLHEHLSLFKQYRANGGVMNRRDFNVSVGQAMRRGDVHKVPEVAASAKQWRSKLYEPLKQRAIQAKFLDEAVEVDTSISYLNRMWDKDAITTKQAQFVKVVSKWLSEKNNANPDIDFDELAQEIASRIKGTPDGRLPYDYKIGQNTSGQPGKQGLKGALKQRVFTIDDELVEEFLQSDIELLGGRYLKNVAADAEIAIDYGDIDMTSAIKDVATAWDDKITAASKKGDDSLARKLEKNKAKDIKDIAAMRDRMRGTFGNVDPDNFWVRAGRTSRDLNYLRFMGGVTASSIPDVARIVMTEGIVNTFSKGLIPMIKAQKGFKIAAAEARRYGVGVDNLMGGRAEIIADVADYSQGGTKFERGIRSAAANFGKINLMDYWTTGVKQLHAVTMQNRLIPDLKKGIYDPQLAQLGISKDNALNIGNQLKKYSEQVDGVWIANTKKWDYQGLADMYGGAMRKESDRVIVIPGQEKPLFMSTELGKSIFQFRSFMFSATQRMTIAGIQGQDAHFMQGIIGLTSLGMMAYAFKQWDAGRDLSDDPRDWVVEGIDRSGVLGIVMEANNTMEKLSNNSFGLRPMLGTSTPSSRFASRSRAEAFLGPSFGSLLSTTLKVTGSATDDEEWQESDTRTLRRLLPYQNLLIFRQALDKVEEEL